MKWNILNDIKSPEISRLKSVLGLSEITSKMLVRRGIDSPESAHNFFNPSIDDLHDPFLMKDMNVAVERMERALADGEKILVYGDYDVDGTTSVAMMYSFLRQKVEAEADVYVPDRYNEGYGISYQGIDYAKDNECSLVIALDCGIKAIDKVEYAKEKGVDFIICDHHTPGEEIPDAVAVLDPKRSDCDYPFKELSGCGVGFKLIQGFSQRNDIAFSEIYEYLDYLAVSIGADIVSMTGENRVLAYFGLELINQRPRPAFSAVRKLYNNQEFDITDVVFKIAPRINAAGRMKHGKYAVNFLIQIEENKAFNHLSLINEFNEERRSTDQEITQEALSLISEDGEEDLHATVLYKSHWHKGVIGIVASRLIEKYYRPTVIFTKSGDHIAGSVRSIEGFDVYSALEKCSEHIIQFGGHKAAAGLTVEEDKFEDFKKAFNRVVETTLEDEFKEETIDIEAEIDMGDINWKLVDEINAFAPFGPDNMRPKFMLKAVKDNGFGRAIGQDNAHLKLNVTSPFSKNTLSAIGFGLGHKFDEIKKGKAFDLVFVIEVNEWNGSKSLQLNIRDLKF